MSNNGLIHGLPHTEIDAALLDYHLWHSPKLQHGEEVYIRDKITKQAVKATFHEEEYTFYVHNDSDGEVKPWDVQWRRIFPESVIERAALNYLAILESQKP